MAVRNSFIVHPRRSAGPAWDASRAAPTPSAPGERSGGTSEHNVAGGCEIGVRISCRTCKKRLSVAARRSVRTFVAPATRGRVAAVAQALYVGVTGGLKPMPPLKVALFSDSHYEANGVARTTGALESYAARRGLQLLSVHAGPE